MSVSVILLQDICRLATQAVGMASAMRQASGVEDELSMNEQEALAELQYEHQALRELLETSRPFLSANQLQVGMLSLFDLGPAVIDLVVHCTL